MYPYKVMGAAKNERRQQSFFPRYEFLSMRTGYSFVSN